MIIFILSNFNSFQFLKKKGIFYSYIKGTDISNYCIE